MKVGTKVQVVFFCSGCSKIEMADSEWAGSRDKTSKKVTMKCAVHGSMDPIGWLEIGGTDDG